MIGIKQSKKFRFKVLLPHNISIQCHFSDLVLLLILVAATIASTKIDIKMLVRNFDLSMFTVAWLSNGLLLYGLIVVYRKTHNLFDFNIIFKFMLFLFCNGDAFLYSIGYKESYLTKVATKEEFLEATIFFFLCFAWYQFGERCVLRQKKTVVKNTVPQMSDTALRDSVGIVALILCVISVAPFGYNYIKDLQQSIRYGYGDLFINRSSVTNGLVAYLEKYFIPSLFLLLYCYKEKKCVSRMLYIFLILIALLYIIGGMRGSGLTIIVALLTYYYNFEKEFQRKDIKKVVLILLCIFIIIPAVYSFRQSTQRSIQELSESVTTTFEDDDNFIVETISELGGSMYPFVLTRRLIPKIYNYRHGESYLASVMMLIPSTFMGGYSFASKAALDTWLMETLNLHYGPGYNIFAETYYNFGWVGGVLCSALLGIFFSLLLTKKGGKTDKDIKSDLFKLIFLYLILIIARYPFHGTLRNLVYIILLPQVLIYIIYPKRKRKTERERKNQEEYLRLFVKDTAEENR